MKSHYKHKEPKQFNEYSQSKVHYNVSAEEKERIKKLNNLKGLKESYLAGLGSGTKMSIKDKGHIMNQDRTGLVINHLNQVSEYASKENTHKFVQEIEEFENRIKPLYPEKLEEDTKDTISRLLQKHGTKKDINYFKKLSSLNEGTGKNSAGSYDSAFAWREDEPALDHQDMFDEEIELDEGGCGDHGDYSDTEEMVIDDQPTDDVDIVLALEPEDDDVEMVDLSTGEFKLGNIFSL